MSAQWLFRILAGPGILAFLIVCAPLAAFAGNGTSECLAARGVIASLEKQLGDSRQVLLVTNQGPSAISATVRALEKRDGLWQCALPPIPAVIGEKGLAPPGEKREGDGRTPSGIFSLGTAFGYGPTLSTRMPYRQAGEDDLWVDDPRSDDYNRWMKKGETKAASFERMRRGDDLYKYGIVIEYNTNPVIKGLGSAIFFHIWAGPGESTAGCVAMAEKNILAILRWLDPAAKPLAVMGTGKERR